MTPDERIEKLLNRAGQTISDLPRANGIGMPYGVDKYEPLLKGACDFTQFNAPAGFEVFNVIQYALHLTDVIDRLETALENVCGERDYLCDRSGCEFCAYERIDGDKMPCRGCTVTKNLYEFAGVPEDWRPGDD